MGSRTCIAELLTYSSSMTKERPVFTADYELQSLTITCDRWTIARAVSSEQFCFHPHMPIGKVWIYRLLFICVCVCLFVCTVTDFSAEDKASGVKFWSAVHRRPRQGISHFVELCFPRSPKSDAHPDVNVTVEMRRPKLHARDAPFVEVKHFCNISRGMWT